MRSNETTNSGRASMSKASAPINVGGDCESDAAHLLRRDTERAVIASMMARSDAIVQARALLTAESFHHTAHAMTFSAICGLHDRGEVADLVTVCDELRTLGLLAAVGGHYGVSLVLDAFPLPDGVTLEMLCSMVVERSERRRWSRFALHLLELVRDPNVQIETVEAFAVNELPALLPSGEVRRAS